MVDIAIGGRYAAAGEAARQVPAADEVRQLPGGPVVRLGWGLAGVDDPAEGRAEDGPAQDRAGQEPSTGRDGGPNAARVAGVSRDEPVGQDSRRRGPDEHRRRDTVETRAFLRGAAIADAIAGFGMRLAERGAVRNDLLDAAVTGAIAVGGIRLLGRGGEIRND